MKLLLIAFLLATAACSFAQTRTYPEHWWTPVIDENAPSWEILPQAAGPGEVILSKRNELGILSNFAATPFEYRGKKYGSVEGFWQMMKYPENQEDPRSVFKLRHTREEVSAMASFEAKDAGEAAKLEMARFKIDWVSFEGNRFTYCTTEPGEHYKLIKEAMWEKLKQNPRVQEILLQTGDLILRPDHGPSSCKAPEWKYYQLWMDIRAELQSQSKK